MLSMSLLERCCHILFFGALSISLSAQITWQKMNGPNESTNAITATSDNDLFLGSNTYGVFTSTDQGVNWQQVNQGLPDVLIRHLVAASNNEVFAGTGSNGIYRYAAGAWSAANGGLPSSTLLTAGMASGNNGEVYMITTSDHIYRWNGGSWSSIKFNLPALVRAVVVGPDGLVYAGCFNSGVYVFNGNNSWTTLGAMPNSFVTRMVISSTNMLFVACNSNNIYRIPASGGSWTSINTGLPASNATAMGIDGNNHIFLTYLINNYGNIYLSSNNGDSWSAVSSDLYTGQFLGFTSDAGGNDYLCGSGVYKSSTGGTSWQDMNPGLDARKAIKSFCAKSNGSLFVGTHASGVWRSTDGGDTWQQKSTGITTFYSDQVMATANGTLLYSAYIPTATNVGVLFRSTDDGESWMQVASNGTDRYTKIKQHFADTVWACGQFGGPVLSFSANNGSTWVNRPISGFSAVWDIEPKPGSVIFLGSESEGVSRSVNGGNTWTEGVGNSESWYGNVIEVEMDQGGYLFAGTDWYNNLIWFSPPGSNGNSWTKFLDADLNGVADIYDLVFDVNNNVYIATSNTPYKDPIYMASNAVWDANTSWVSMSDGLPPTAPILELGFDPVGYMYAVAFKTGQEGGLYKSATPVNIPLPIQLVSFSGLHRNHINQLEWRTASELQNKLFVVERSADGIHFYKLGELPGHEKSSTLTVYTFNDDVPLPSKNYYRLKQVDLNGQVAYSNLIIIENTDADLRLAPNPGRDQISFSKSLDFFEVYNAYGQKVMERHTPASSVSVTNFDNGVYYIRSGATVRKFWVQH